MKIARFFTQKSKSLFLKVRIDLFALYVKSDASESLFFSLFVLRVTRANCSFRSFGKERGERFAFIAFLKEQEE